MLRVSLQTLNKMKPIVIKRFPLCCTANLKLAQRGAYLRNTLRHKELPSDSPLRVIQSVIDMPVGEGFLSALLRSPIVKDVDESPYIRIRSHMKRHQRSGYSILVQDFTMGLEDRALEAFSQSAPDALMMELRQIIPPDILPTRSSWNDLLSAMDASTLGMGYPASLISYLNFVDDFAISTHKETLTPKKSFSKRSLKKYHKVVAEILSTNEDIEKIENRWLQDFESQGDKESDLIRIAIFYAKKFTEEKKSIGTSKGKVKPGTDRTYLMEIPRAYEVLFEGTLSGRLDGPLSTAVSIIRACGLERCEHENASVLLRKGRNQIPASVTLWTPHELDSALEYSSAPDAHGEDETFVAQCMIKILLRNGLVRFDSLLKVQLSDFKYLKNLIEWRIRDSKGKELDLPLPLSLLTPEPACEFFRSAWQRLMDKHGSQALLLELAGITINNVFKNETHAEWKTTMNAEARSHIGRITGVSWLPLRVLCLHYPKVLEHPTLANIVNHEWFSAIELEKLRMLFPSTSVDTAEVIRLLVGWEDKQQFYRSYLRINHILLMIHRDIILS